MLQTQSVHSATLELLKKLMAFEPLANFNLVGGTALALQFGHRISVDLDLFSYPKFNKDSIKLAVESFAKKEGAVLEWEVLEEVTLIGSISGIKVDIIHYPYELIDDLIVEDGIRLLSAKDIAPMKLSAIAQRGSKKDFFDFYELLNVYSLAEMITFYREKFPQVDTTFLLRALTYFEDAEKEENPTMIKSYTWQQVKTTLAKTVNQYIDSRI